MKKFLSAIILFMMSIMPTFGINIPQLKKVDIKSAVSNWEQLDENIYLNTAQFEQYQIEQTDLQERKNIVSYILKIYNDGSNSFYPYIDYVLSGYQATLLDSSPINESYFGLDNIIYYLKTLILYDCDSHEVTNKQAVYYDLDDEPIEILTIVIDDKNLQWNPDNDIVKYQTLCHPEKNLLKDVY